MIAEDSPSLDALTLNPLDAILAQASESRTVMPHLFVVLPAYNEGEDLVKLVWELEQILKPFPFHLIVVDDGSSDGSIELLEQANFEHVNLIRHPHNKGLGEGLKTGFSAVLRESTQEGDYVIVLDSDSTHTPSLIERMVGRIREGNDVVIASRYRYGSRVIGLSPFREFLSQGSSWVCRVLAPIPGVKDYTCGYRAYRVGILRKAFAHYGDHFISEAGFACMAEILIKLNRIGAIASEIPLILRYDRKTSTSKMKVYKTTSNLLRLLLRNLLGCW